VLVYASWQVVVNTGKPRSLRGARNLSKRYQNLFLGCDDRGRRRRARGCEVLYSEDLSHGQGIRRRAGGEPVPGFKAWFGDGERSRSRDFQWRLGVEDGAEKAPARGRRPLQKSGVTPREWAGLRVLAVTRREVTPNFFWGRRSGD